MKQKLSFNLSLALIIIGFLINATAIKANAGDSVVTGSSVDSSSFGGDSFSPANSSSGQTSISPASQASVNSAASNILSQAGTGGDSEGGGASPNAAAVAILTGGANASAAASQIQNALGGAGVSSQSSEQLTSSMQGMISNSSAAVSGIPVANNKSLAKNFLLAQNSQPSVDINKLNAAVNACNKIVMESDAKTLKQLATNPEFMAVRNILNQLRTALNG